MKTQVMLKQVVSAAAFAGINNILRRICGLNNEEPGFWSWQKERRVRVVTLLARNDNNLSQSFQKDLPLERVVGLVVTLDFSRSFVSTRSFLSFFFSAITFHLFLPFRNGIGFPLFSFF